MNAPLRTTEDTEFQRDSGLRPESGRPSRLGAGRLGKGWALLGLLAALGCSEQAEGERCDPANKNSDCEGGLSCVPLSVLHRGTEGAVCCPENNATADVCLQVDFAGDGDEQVPTSAIPTSSVPAPDATDSTGSSGPTDTSAVTDASGSDAGSSQMGSSDTAELSDTSEPTGTSISDAGSGADNGPATPVDASGSDASAPGASTLDASRSDAGAPGTDVFDQTGAADGAPPDAAP